MACGALVNFSVGDIDPSSTNNSTMNARHFETRLAFGKNHERNMRYEISSIVKHFSAIQDWAWKHALAKDGTGTITNSCFKALGGEIGVSL